MRVLIILILLSFAKNASAGNDGTLESKQNNACDIEEFIAHQKKINDEIAKRASDDSNGNHQIFDQTQTVDSHTSSDLNYSQQINEHLTSSTLISLKVEAYHQLASAINKPNNTIVFLTIYPQLTNALVIDRADMTTQHKSIMEIIFEKYLRYRNDDSKQPHRDETTSPAKFAQYIKNKFEAQPEAAERLLSMLQESSKPTLSENTVEYSIHITLLNCMLVPKNSNNDSAKKENWDKYERVLDQPFNEHINRLLPALFQSHLDYQINSQLALRNSANQSSAPTHSVLQDITNPNIPKKRNPLDELTNKKC